MTLESSRTLGGVGAVLMLAGSLAIFGAQAGTVFIGVVSGVLVLVGAILVLVALSGLAGFYQERRIFSNALYSFIALIVGAVAAFGAVLYIVFDTTALTNLLKELYPTWNGSWSTISSFSGVSPDTSNITVSAVLALVGALFLVLVILWIFLIVSALFARRSLNSLSAKADVHLLSTASLVLIVGAFLTIILIGFIIVWVAVLLMAVAFFQIKSQPQQTPAAVASPSPMPTPV